MTAEKGTLTIEQIKKAKKIMDDAPISPHLYKQVSTGKMYYIFPYKSKPQEAKGGL